jgi:hypothetical protein
MIYSKRKNWLTCLICMIYCSLSFGQTKSKSDLYLYFKTDLSKKIYKSNLISQAKAIENNKQASAACQNIYHYSYLTKDGTKEFSYQLLASIPGTNPIFSDNKIFSKYNIVPFQNLEKIKGLIADSWDSSKFPYSRVFVVEKIAKTRYKVVQVQLYFPFNSEGVKIRQVKKN